METNLTTREPAAAPRVAVIVPAYGVAQFAGEALESVRRQTLPDWECVVIDDGSPDDVAAAVAPFLADSRFRLLKTANRGVSAARNRAVRDSRAPLIALLDGDDRLRPDYLATMAPFLEGDPQVRIATCNGLMFGELPAPRLCVERKQGHGDGVRGSLADVLDRSFNVYIGSTFRRADFDAIGGFDETMSHSEDLDLWVRLMQLGGVAHYVDAVLGEYRVRAGSASGSPERLLRGLVQVYAKARDTLPAASAERLLAERLLAEMQDELAFEQAIDRIIAGQASQGLAQLRATRGMTGGPVWRASLALWRMFPALARPMLGRRRRAHLRARGGHGPAVLAP